MTSTVSGDAAITYDRRHASGIVVALVLLVPAVLAGIVAVFVALAVNAGPHQVPIGVAAPPQVVQTLETSIAAQAGGDAFDLRAVDDEAQARTGLRERTLDGAIVVDQRGVTVLTADAGSVPLAQVVTSLGTGIAQAQSVPVTVVPVVAAPVDDPRGSGLAAGLLPTLIAGLVTGAIAGLVLAGRLALQVVALVLGPLVAGFAFAGVWQGLGAIDGHVVAVALSAALMIGAIAWFTAGAAAALGVGGLGLSAVLMILIANPLSGLMASPRLVPSPWGEVGQWLPPGAGGTLLRSSAFFPDATTGVAGPAWVLAGWVVLGAGMLAVGVLRGRRTAAA
ncbi:hypothetical protein GCM10009624_34180 [Gordonia sinesedis]